MRAFYWWRFIAAARSLIWIIPQKQHKMLLRVCVCWIFEQQRTLKYCTFCLLEEKKEKKKEKRKYKTALMFHEKSLLISKIASFAAPSRIVVRLITTEQEMGKSTFASEIRFRLFMQSLRISMHVLRPLCCDGLHSNVEQRGISLKCERGKKGKKKKNKIASEWDYCVPSERQKKNPKTVMRRHRRAEEDLW